MAALVDVVGGLTRTQHEIPFARITWREGATIRIVEVGAHCYDSAWPWWRPHPPWVPLERGTPMAKKKAPTKPARPKKAAFVDPRGTLEQRIDHLSDRVRKLELAIEAIVTIPVNTEAAPSSETRHIE